MNQAELLRYVVDALETLRIPYMIGGSQAAMYYGEPRLTRDIDIVADLEPTQLSGLRDRFPPSEFYLSDDAMREAVETRGQFNIIHPASGLKIDIFVNRDTPYDRRRMERRQRLPLVPGREAWFARPEDVILYKLIYYREGQSELHLRDVVGILRVSGDDLDRPYLTEWVERLGLRGLWEAVLKRAAHE